MESKRIINENLINKFFEEFNKYGAISIYGWFYAENSVISTALIEYLKTGINHMQEYCDIIYFKEGLNSKEPEYIDKNTYTKYHKIIYGKDNFWNTKYFMSDEEIEYAEKFLLSVYFRILSEKTYEIRKKESKKNNKKALEILLQTTDCCANCGTKTNLTLDHKIPLKHGGENTIDNYQVLCKSCNSKKGANI